MLLNKLYGSSDEDEETSSEEDDSCVESTDSEYWKSLESNASAPVVDASKHIFYKVRI